MEAREVAATDAVAVVEQLHRTLSIIAGRTVLTVGTRVQIVPDAHTDIKLKQRALIKRGDAQQNGKDIISENRVQIKLN